MVNQDSFDNDRHSEPASAIPHNKLGLKLLLVAGTFIAIACIYKATRNYEPVDREALRPKYKKNAPAFELYDYQKPQQVVRLATYLGRHRILLVFFDRQIGWVDDPTLKLLREKSSLLNSSKTIVIAISDALPQENRKRIKQYLKTDPDFKFPFLLVTDPKHTVHQMYGRYDQETESLIPGLFVIDRKGQIEQTQTGPKTSSASAAAIEKLVTQSK